jgi:hypothetical protein
MKKTLQKDRLNFDMYNMYVLIHFGSMCFV